MRRFIYLIIISVFLLPTFSPSAPRFYVNTGISNPYAPDTFTNHWRSGYNLGLGAGYPLSTNLEIIGQFHYDNFQLDDISYLKDITDSDLYASATGGSTWIAGFLADLKLYSPLSEKSTITPYLVGGLGLFTKTIQKIRITLEEGTYEETKESDMPFGAGLGLGAEILMGKRTYFIVEGRFNVLFTDETTVYMPIKLGISIK